MGFMSVIAAAAGPVGGLLSAYGAYKGAGAEKRASQSELAGLTRERELGREKAEELYGEYLPAAGFGAEAMQQLRDVIIGGDMSKFQESPGYQFRLGQGTEAIEKAFAARGGRRSSTAFKSISDYAQQSASDEYSNYLNQLGGFAAQAGQTGLEGARGIMSQYGGVSPGSIAQATLGVGQAKSARTQALWGGIGKAIQGGGMAMQPPKKPPGTGGVT